MPRPRKCCRVAFVPGVSYYKPAGVPLRFLDEVSLSIEEIEAIRLKDCEDFDQEQAAGCMHISRATFQRILESAHKKVSEALIRGKAIKIQGGNFEVALVRHRCENGHEWEEPLRTSEGPSKSCPVCGTAFAGPLGNFNTIWRSNMKIAVISDDEVTISQHFGRASLYMVFNVENGKITGKEKRPKMGHSHFTAAGSHEGHGGQGGPHGFDAASQGRHASMAEAISDCQVLIAGGMGMGAFESMKSYNIEPVITDKINIEEAVKLYAEGKLPNLMNRLH